MFKHAHEIEALEGVAVYVRIVEWKDLASRDAQQERRLQHYERRSRSISF